MQSVVGVSAGAEAAVLAVCLGMEQVEPPVVLTLGTMAAFQNVRRVRALAEVATHAPHFAAVLRS
eukprot:11328374-Prorocentrum_lima.AAC.1